MLLAAAIALVCDTAAKLLAEAPTAAAVAPVPVALADTAPELVALADCEMLELLLWLAEMLIDCEIAPPETAAISTSVNKIRSVMVCIGSLREWHYYANAGVGMPIS
jgi:hypothetical protein